MTTTNSSSGSSTSSSTGTRQSTSKSSPTKSGSGTRKKAVIENGETGVGAFLEGGEKPKPEAVQMRAWEIWREEGCPEGRQLEHWLRAEKELGLKH